MFVLRLLPVVAMLATIGQSARHWISRSETLPDDLTVPDPAKFTKKDGLAWVFENPPCDDFTKPVYRLQNKNSNLLLFTSDDGEAQNLANQGDWVRRGTLFHVFKETQPSTMELHRLYNPTDKTHLLSKNPDEITRLTEGGGWKKDGLIGYVPAKKDSYSDAVQIFIYADTS